MKPTDFSRYISEFISKYLTNERESSRNTIVAYGDTFILLLTFIEKHRKVKLHKLTLGHIKKETIIDFLDWIQTKRKWGNSTRNLRLAAIHSFYGYLQYQHLNNLFECQRILAIKPKKAAKNNFTYLSIDGFKLLLQQPDTTSRKGRHMLQAGINLVYIRDVLGHVSVLTTEIYARADSKQKRIALEKAYENIHPEEKPIWVDNENLISWLKRF